MVAREGEGAGFADEIDLLAHQTLGLEAALRQRVVEAGEIDLAAHQPLMDIEAEAADDLEEDVGVGGIETLGSAPARENARRPAARRR